MTFGQVSGPPASSKQMQELVALLHDAGHSDFRDARGPMGFTQRQAAGKFTRDEADGFIAELQAGGTAESAVEAATDEELAAELTRRGWTVRQPAARPDRST